MSRFFMDTSYVQSYFNSKDEWHRNAIILEPRVRIAREVVTTEAVLLEVGNALSSLNRTGATQFIETCYSTSNIIVVPFTTALLRKSLSFYQKRRDKEWGLTDCMSFVVMEEHALLDSLTSDSHFIQAGFRALLLSPLP